MSAWQCPTGCGRKHQPDKMLCGPCWSKVPIELQAEVYRAWNALRPLRAREDRQAFALAYAAWKNARDRVLQVFA